MNCLRRWQSRRGPRFHLAPGVRSRNRSLSRVSRASRSALAPSSFTATRGARALWKSLRARRRRRGAVVSRALRAVVDRGWRIAQENEPDGNSDQERDWYGGPRSDHARPAREPRSHSERELKAQQGRKSRYGGSPCAAAENHLSAVARTTASGRSRSGGLLRRGGCGLVDGRGLGRRSRWLRRA